MVLVLPGKRKRLWRCSVGDVRMTSNLNASGYTCQPHTQQYLQTRYFYSSILLGFYSSFVWGVFFFFGTLTTLWRISDAISSVMFESFVFHIYILQAQNFDIFLQVKHSRLLFVLVLSGPVKILEIPLNRV